jgi:hypothetical protein
MKASELVAFKGMSGVVRYEDIEVWDERAAHPVTYLFGLIQRTPEPLWRARHMPSGIYSGVGYYATGRAEWAVGDCILRVLTQPPEKDSGQRGRD